MTEKQLPEKKFRIGGVTATIWKNINMVGDKGKEIERESHSVTLERSYKDKKDEWQKTNSYNQNDIPKAITVLRKAYEYVNLLEDK